MSAEFDRTGRTAAMAGFASKLGLASGPFLGGWMIGGHVYGLLINVSVLALGLSAIAMLYPAALLDSERPSSPQPAPIP
jgi:Na+/melibiose symporter-like transporter